MRRLTPLALVVLIFGVLITANASATTYYIAANGNDSNNGTSKTSPWLHAPGMSGCSGSCASTTPQAGDKFILRGGDTWHWQSGAPTGLPWSWKWSGSSSNCQLNPAAGAVVNGSCIYIGVDQGWFTGSDWTRPAFSADNALSTSRPSTCAHDTTNLNAVDLGGQNYVIFDNFELLGACWQGATNANYVTISGNQVQASNLYIHGWTYGSNSNDDDYHLIGGNMSKGNYVLCDHNVFDGSDSSLGTTAGEASGFAINNTCKEIAFNVFRHVSNGCICNPSSVHDNLFEYLYEPTSSQHGNIIETNTAQSVTGPVYFYNNVMHNTNEGVGVWLETVSDDIYIFNNVSWHYRENTNGTNGNDGTNCYMIDQTSASADVYLYNNTNDYPCNFRTLNGAVPTVHLGNNQYIGYPGGLSSTYTISGPVVDAGHHVFQTEAAANSQGYTSSNNYAPTSASDATVGTGSDLSSFCNGLPNAMASSACASGMGGVTYDASNHVVVPVATVARATGGAWDVAAYEFGSGGTPPNPPTGLTAIVQ